MNEPNTPWPDASEASRRYKQSMKTGHTQLVLKCMNCGLEFIIQTWRTGAELAAAFGIYGDLEPVAECDLKKLRVEKSPLPKGIPVSRSPDASQVSCPECAKRGDVVLINYRRAKGPIHRRGE